MPGRAGPRDSYANFTPLMGDPAGRWVAVTKSDTNDLPFVPKAVYVGTNGDVRIIDNWDNDTVIPSVPAGSILPGRWKRILSTGTTASGFVLIGD